ncbi:MAG: sialidase domain-containing protein [Clostridium septicum]|uniref:sialidase domain-containing protein n=1 Tax=Clostridium septicum TaxID=1504 RepID=UPI0025854AFF|nr:sialidase domain-containing protein [Clostridium septicum]MDU1312995.1 sialidase domain-containing protein [Clostridium septicum]
MNKKKIMSILVSAFLITNLSSNIIFADIKENVYINQYSEGNRSQPIAEKLVPRSEIQASATSAQSGEGPEKAIDGNTSTLWHTPWAGVDIQSNPQSLTLKLGKTRNISSICVTPRQEGTNGMIMDYKIYSGDDVIAEGKWKSDSSDKYVVFDNPISTDNIRIEAISTVGDENNKHASIAEVEVYEVADTPVKLAESNNKVINNGNGGNYEGDISEISLLEEGTAIIRFTNNGSGIQSLFSISNNERTNEHFHVYINGGAIGYELRKQSGNLATGSVNKALNAGINTIAFKAEKGKGYSIYLNGEKILTSSSITANFLSTLEGLNTLSLGKTDRPSGSNEYKFTGEIDFFELYSKPLADRYLKERTGETTSKDLPFPEGAVKTEPVDIFTPGELGSNNFRIPALYTTKDGTVLASIDVRKGGGHDAPNNIDTGIKRSTDGGVTWDEGKIILDYPGASSAIDTSLLQDDETGRIFLIVTHFAEGYGFGNSKTGSGYVEIEGKRYLKLLGANDTIYTVREEGVVYDSNGEATNYTVDNNNELYENGNRIGNVLLSNSLLKVMGTSFLSLIYSDDDGQTWSDPIDLNKEVKTDWMRFLGTGPGKGHQIKTGRYAGRLLFPVYLTNASGFQSSAVIYSDDNGATWNIGETATDGRLMDNGDRASAETITTNTSGGVGQLTECQVVEMPNGQLKMFMRNTGGNSGRVRIATSFDGGATWEDDVVRDENIKEPYCQLSVINYSQKIDGKDAIIFANPDANYPNRVNGTVRVGLITENGSYENGEPRYDIEWRYNKVVAPGTYGYSCLSEMPNGEIGLFYEGTGSREMSFTRMNIDYLKADLLQDVPAANIKSYTTNSENNIYDPGDKISLNVTFDQTVSLIGDRTITADIGGKEVLLTLANSKGGSEYTFEGTVPADISNGNYTITIKGKSGLKIVNVVNKVTDITEDRNTGLNVQVGEEVQSVDKSLLQDLVDSTSNLIKEDYTEESWILYEKALEVANKVLVNESAVQEEVDAAKATLENAINNLTKKETDEVFKRHLEIAVEEAEKITDKELENVVPIVVKEFKNAIKEAKYILSNKEATREEVDKSFDRLSSVMQKLSFYKGDKTELTKLVEKINNLDESEYIKSTWENLQSVLGEVNVVINDVNAMEKEVLESYDKLMKAFLDLRLKPNKDQLEELINKAETIDSKKYTKESIKNLNNALELAKSIINNEDATEKEVRSAENSLEDALKNLVAVNDGNSNNNGNSNNGSNNNSGTNSNNKPGKGNNKLPQTGGVPATAVGLLGSIFATAGIVIFKKRK